MKILSWNVNGIRAVAQKGFFEWLKKEDADIICLQEIKAFEHQLEPALKYPPGYEAVWHSGKRPGYAGTVIYTKIEPVSKKTKWEGKYEVFHEEGRVVQIEFSKFVLLNIYFPNGGTKANGEERLTYKLNFYDRVIEYMNDLKSNGKSIIVCGDFNICHTEIDIARPKENVNSIGFLPVEREKIDEVIHNGYIDVFRHFYPDMVDAYTWWSYRAGARPKNVGWRLDYFFITPDLIKKITKIEHQTEVMGSDHCPLNLEIEV